MVKAVVFDIGMVFAEWHPERFYDSKIGEERRKRLFAETDLHKMNEAIDLGTHSRDAAYTHAEKHPEWATEIRWWHDHWLDMCAPEIPGTDKLLFALKSRGVPVFALSNFGWNTLELAKETYPALKQFDQEYVSGHLGVMKPDPAFYEALERGSGLSGSDLIFTDDKPENIATAADRGWHVHLFEGPEGWHRKLVEHGLLGEADAP